MDITLIKRGDYYRDKKTEQDIVSETEIARLADCGMVLLHKVGERPLYIAGNDTDKDLILAQKPEKILEKPDLILYSPNEPDTQSAKIIQFQLGNGNCPTEIRSVDFIENASNVQDPKIYKNMFKKHLDSLAEEGHKHIVIVADEKELNKMACSFNNQGLNPKYNLPIYSFSAEKEVVDNNLIDCIYVTRDLLDSVLLWQFEHSEDPTFKGKKGKYKSVLGSEYIRAKLNLPRSY